LRLKPLPALRDQIVVDIRSVGRTEYVIEPPHPQRSQPPMQYDVVEDIAHIRRNSPQVRQRPYPKHVASRAVSRVETRTPIDILSRPGPRRRLLEKCPRL